MRELNAVLDTSAIICVLEDEPGAHIVEQQLRFAANGRVQLGMSAISLVEVYYKTHQKAGKAQAERLISMIKSWPLEIIYPDELLCLAAGEIKALFPVSFADAFIAATARETHAALYHKDLEFESLNRMVKLKTLPYKRGR